MKELKKVYAIEFNQYTNYTCKTVAHNDNGSDAKTLDYLDMPEGVSPLLIFEDEIDKYRQYGNGIKLLKLVGEMYVSEKE